MATTITGEASGTSNATTITPQLADQSVSDVNLTDSNTLTATLAASSTYEFAFMLEVTIGAGGMKIALDGTVGVTAVNYQICYLPSSGTGTLVATARSSLGDAQAVSTSTDDTSVAWVFGAIVTSTSGTFKLRFAERVSTSSVTVLEGSYLRLVKSA